MDGSEQEPMSTAYERPNQDSEPNPAKPSRRAPSRPAAATPDPSPMCPISLPSPQNPACASIFPVISSRETLVACPSGDTGRRHGARGRAAHHVTCLRVRIWVKRGERCWERYWGEERAVMPGRGLWGSVGRWREKEEGGKDARFVGVRKGGARLMGRGRAG